MDYGILFILSNQIRNIFLYRTDSSDSEIINQDLCHIRGKECWKCRSQVDISDSKGKQSQEYDHRFLLIPGDIVHDRKVVDIFQFEYFLQFQCDHSQ